MEKNVQLTPPVARFGKRHVQVALMALASFMVYGLRINLSVAIVAMTGQDAKRRHGGLNTTDTFNSTEIVDDDLSTAASIEQYPVYDWDEGVQALVLSSFFWGYLMTQIPAGILSQRYGGHRFLSFALLSTSALSALLPPCAYLGGHWAVIINRIMQGITQGCVYPSVFTLMGLWVPSTERSVLTGIILSAQNLGPVVATPAAGFLAAYCGWPSIFYWFGAAGMCVGLAVLVYGADSPNRHRTIDAEEQAYIEQSLGSAKEKIPIPWGKLVTSLPVWSAIVTLSMHGGVFLTFLTKIPTYLSSVLKFDIKDNGVLSALPYLCSLVLAYVFSGACEILTDRKLLTLTQARKVFNSIAHVGPAVTMILLGYSTNTTACVVLLTLAVGFMSASYQGVQSNFMDLAPNFSGTVFSIANFMSAIAGVAGPLMVGVLVTEPGSVSQWRLVYFMLAAVMFLSNIFFIICGTAEVQSWNFPVRRGSQSSRKGERLAYVS